MAATSSSELSSCSSSNTGHSSAVLLSEELLSASRESASKGRAGLHCQAEAAEAVYCWWCGWELKWEPWVTGKQGKQLPALTAATLVNCLQLAQQVAVRLGCQRQQLLQRLWQPSIGLQAPWEGQ